MCYEVKCSTCNKRSWSGCGRHVQSVYNKIPEGQHCTCKGWPGVSVGSSANGRSDVKAADSSVGCCVS